MLEFIIIATSFASILVSNFVFQEKTVLFISQSCLALLAFIALYRLYQADISEKVKFSSLGVSQHASQGVSPDVTTKEPTSVAEPSKGKKVVNQENLEKFSSLKKQFLEMADLEASPAGEKETDIWDLVLSRNSTKPDSVYKIQVHQKKKCDFTFRIVVEMVRYLNLIQRIHLQKKPLIIYLIYPVELNGMKFVQVLELSKNWIQ